MVSDSMALLVLWESMRRATILKNPRRTGRIRTRPSPIALHRTNGLHCRCGGACRRLCSRTVPSSKAAMSPTSRVFARDSSGASASLAGRDPWQRGCRAWSVPWYARRRHAGCELGRANGAAFVDEGEHLVGVSSGRTPACRAVRRRSPSRGRNRCCCASAPGRHWARDPAERVLVFSCQPYR